MKGIMLKDKAETLAEEFCISTAREEELDYRMEMIMHDYHRPTKDKTLPPPRVITKLFLALAQNEQELAYLAFNAGTQVQLIVSTYEDADE